MITLTLFLCRLYTTLAMKREQALQINGFALDVGPTTSLDITSTSPHDHLMVTRERIYKYLP